MYRAVIIDDELSGIKSLQFILNQNAPQVKVVATSTNPEEGIVLIENYQPEIVFLDINMPGMNAFSLLKSLPDRNFSLVFTTAHREYAIEAIREEAVDYLLKPIDSNELLACLNRIRASRDAKPANPPAAVQQGLTPIAIAVKDGIEFVRQSDIIRLEASGSYTYFYLENNIKHVASKSLKEYEMQLSPQLFCRCHHSHIVNVTKVMKFVNQNGFFARMTDGSLVDVSRKNKDSFLDKLRHSAA